MPLATPAPGSGAAQRRRITGLILAGGRGSRMANIDKGLQLFRAKPLVAHARERFGPQVDELLISANRNTAEYEKFGRVIADADDQFSGPLAGLLAGMQTATHSLIATAPCDSPFLPDDLVSRLYAALEAEKAEFAVARTHDQSHPVFCLAETRLVANLQAFLDHVSSLRPAAAKGDFFRKISLSTSMGPGVRIAWEVVHA